ncbi:MAG: pantetheine-phosphate adenylyltransferase [Rikenellaceae bacterium]
MDRIAIFPGSFDPFTRGHAAVVEQALLLFDRVVVAVGYNTAKSSFMSVEARMDLIKDLYASNDRVDVDSYEGLTVDYASSRGAVAMIRGVRSTIDFEYERSLAAINSRLSRNVVTVVLYSPAELADVSSHVVRELYSFGHSVDEFLPEGVKLENYINRQVE